MKSRIGKEPPAHRSSNEDAAAPGSTDGSGESAVWQALADATRRRLLELLVGGPRTTGELCEFVALSRFGVMKHLRALADAGLVDVERRGRERWNSLNTGPLAEIVEPWLRRCRAAMPVPDSGGGHRPWPVVRRTARVELNLEED